MSHLVPAGTLSKSKQPVSLFSSRRSFCLSLTPATERRSLYPKGETSLGEVSRGVEWDFSWEERPGRGGSTELRAQLSLTNNTLTHQTSSWTLQAQGLICPTPCYQPKCLVSGILTHTSKPIQHQLKPAGNTTVSAIIYAVSTLDPEGDRGWSSRTPEVSWSRDSLSGISNNNNSDQTLSTYYISRHCTRTYIYSAKIY